MLVQGRFAARIPGPVDPAATARAKLVDGAWAGRFAHRFKAFTTPDKTLVDRVKADLAEAQQASIAATRRSRTSTSATRL